MSEKNINGTKEVFIKSISKEVSSPIDQLLHNLEYSHYDMIEDKHNVWNQLDNIKICITDSPETTEAFNNLKTALHVFEEVTDILMKVSPRDKGGDYNTIVDKRDSE